MVEVAMHVEERRITRVVSWRGSQEYGHTIISRYLLGHDAIWTSLACSHIVKQGKPADKFTHILSDNLSREQRI